MLGLMSAFSTSSNDWCDWGWIFSKKFDNRLSLIAKWVSIWMYSWKCSMLSGLPFMWFLTSCIWLTTNFSILSIDWSYDLVTSMETCATRSVSFSDVLLNGLCHAKRFSWHCSICFLSLEVYSVHSISLTWEFAWSSRIMHELYKFTIVK